MAFVSASNRGLSLLQRVGSGIGALLRPPRVTPMREMGVSGTPVWSGYVQQRENSAAWIGRQKYITISDMAVNTTIIAAGVHYFVNLIAHPKWTLEAADDSDEAKKAADLVEECLYDLTSPWSTVVRRTTTFRFYGFGIQEWTAKRRPDGKIGLASIEPRPQHTIELWATADDGTIEGVWQRDPKTGALLGIPRSKFLYLVDDVLTDSPEGTGLFRHLAEPWERLKMYHELEARAFERDLRGIPVGRIPYTLINQAVDRGDLTQANADLLVKGMEEFVRLQVKQSDTSITMDSLPYYSEAADGAKVASVPQWGLELLTGPANGLKEIDVAIRRTHSEMARILSTEVLLMGELAGSGNRSLSQDKSQNLYLIANAVLGDIVGGVERDIVAPLCDLNGISEDMRPKCKVEDVSFKDAETVAATLQRMALAGAVLPPNDPAINDVRGLLGVSLSSPISPEQAGVLGNNPTGTTHSSIHGAGGSPPTSPGQSAATPASPQPGPSQNAPGVTKNSSLRTLYVHRQLLNADEVRAWAATQGIKSTLSAGGMHVTVAFSREPVDWSTLRPDQGTMVAIGGDRFAHQFAPKAKENGALVLRFDSPALEARWRAFQAAGASWDFPDYAPHITLTYSVPAADVASIEPYTGPLVFGPEVFQEVNEDWANSVDEVPTAQKRYVPRRRN